MSEPAKKKRKQASTPFSFDARQQHVLQRILAGQSVFVYGPAGTGKTQLVRALRVLLPAHRRRTTFVTAMTGIAATHISGTTFHSFAGIGLGNQSLEDMIRRLYSKRPSSKQAKLRWQSATMLIIDEISMMSAALFEAMNQLAQTLRNNDRPWGGIQLVFSGDFLQLPPVRGRFCFQASSWHTSVTTMSLQTIYRQQKDLGYQQLLQRLRLGHLCDRDYETLLRCVDRQWQGDVQPTRLYPHRRTVETQNHQKLRQLPGEERVFRARFTGRKQHRAALETSCLAPTELRLKVGAQVLLLQNLSTEEGLVNGALGLITRFISPTEDEQDGDEYPEVRFHNGTTRVLTPGEWRLEMGDRLLASVTQIPCCLGWNLTIHKAQGLSLDRIVVDLRHVFEQGQAYVALSRVRQLQGLSLVQTFPKRSVRAHTEALRFDALVRTEGTSGAGETSVPSRNSA